jgi:S-adenosylmethionine synthetase
MKANFMFTSESVTEGHPDKLCDQISDAIVDQFLEHDPYSRVIAECAISTAIAFIAARFSSQATIDFPAVARSVINQIGYSQQSFNGKTCSIVNSLRELPFDERSIFDEKRLSDHEIDRIPVKNQVTAFGFACTQTPAFMPLPIWLAHKLARKLTSVRHQKILPYIAPDGKTQVGVEFRNRKPYRIHSIAVVASQDEHADSDAWRA